MIKTKTYKIIDPYLAAMRALAANAIDAIKWRHAGLGVLQAYLYEGEKNEMRLHIWHPDLKKPGMKDHGDIHDHRFDLRSYVLHGRVYQTEFEAEPSPHGDWRLHGVTHARLAHETTGTYHETKLGEQACAVRNTGEMYVPAGFFYEYPKRLFHRSDIDDLTVTLVEKLDQDEIPARILSKLDSPVVHSFTDTLSDKEFAPYLRMAKEALLSHVQSPGR